MTIQQFLSGPFMNRLGWTLVHSIWEGAAIATLFAVAMAASCKRSPQARYLASTITLALLLPCVGVTLNRVPVPGAAPSKAARSASDEPRSSATNDSTRVIAEASAPTVRSTASGADLRIPVVPVVRTSPQKPAPLSLPVPLRDRMAWVTPWFVGAWVIGVLLLSLRHLGGWVAAQRLRVLRVGPVGAEILGLTQRIARQLKLSRAPLVLQSFIAETPIVVGWIRPIVLLPMTVLTSLSSQQLEAVIAHELAHVRRHDYLVNLFQVAAETLLFYHPAAWLISRRIRLEREQCCDDVALSICEDRCTYASSLAALEEVRLAGSMAMAARGLGGSQLITRVRRLLGQADAAPRRVTSATTALLVFTLTGLLIAGLWLRSSSARAGDTKNQKDSAPATATTGAIGKPVYRLQADARVTRVAYSADSKLLAVGGEKAMAIILNASTGETIATLKLLGAADKAALIRAEWPPAAVDVHALAFSPDSSTLAVYTNIGQVKLFDVRTGAILLSLNDASVSKSELSAKASKGDIFSIAFSPDGAMLATCGEPISFLTPNPKLEGLGINSVQLKLWDAKTGALIRDLMGRGELGFDVAFSPDGTFLASTGVWEAAKGDYVFGVKLWDPQTGKVLQAIRMPDNSRANSIAISPDSKQLAIGTVHYNEATDVTSGAIRIVSPVSAIAEPAWKTPIAAWKVESSSDENRFATKAHYEPHPWMARVSFSPEGTMIAARSAASAVTVWDAQTRKPITEVPAAEHRPDVRRECFAFSPKVNVMAIGGVDDQERGFVEVWENTAVPAQSNGVAVPVVGSTTTPVDGAWLNGLWIHERNDKPGAHEPPYYILQLESDGRWATSAIWGTPQKPDRAVIYARGKGFELARLGPEWFQGRAQAREWLPRPEYSLLLPMGGGSSYGLGELARKDADTIVFHRFSSIHWASGYVRAAPALQQTLQGLLAAAPLEDRAAIEARAAFVSVERFARLPMDQQAAGFAHFYRDIAPASVSPIAVMILSNYPENIFKEAPSGSPVSDYESRWVKQIQEAASTLSPEQIAENLHFVMVRAGAHVRTLDVLRKHPGALAKLINEDLDSKALPAVKRACDVIGTLKLPGFTDRLVALYFSDAALSPAVESALVWLADPKLVRLLLDEIEKDPGSLISSAGLFQGPLAGRLAEPALLKLLDSTDADLRNAAAYALAECVDSRLAAPAAKLAADPDPRLNEAALRLAIKLPDDAFKTIRADLLPLLQSKTPAVEFTAITCFAKRKDLVVGPVIWNKLQLETIDEGNAVIVMQAMSKLAGSTLGYDPHQWGWAHNQAAIMRFEVVLRNAGVQIGEKRNVRGSAATPAAVPGGNDPIQGKAAKPATLPAARAADSPAERAK